VVRHICIQCIGYLVFAKTLSRNKPLWKAATSKLKLNLKAKMIEQERFCPNAMTSEFRVRVDLCIRLMRIKKLTPGPNGALVINKRCRTRFT